MKKTKQPTVTSQAKTKGPSGKAKDNGKANDRTRKANNPIELPKI